MNTQSLSVLLVDDDADDIFFIQRAFQKCNLRLSQIHIAHNGEQALETLQCCVLDQNLPDLVFLDWNMPIMGGRDVLSALRESTELSLLPVIVLSTSNRPSEIEEAYALGSRSFITKPSSFEELVEVIRSIHDHWIGAVNVSAHAG
jgi:CheY-like chemotaxis protein